MGHIVYLLRYHPNDFKPSAFVPTNVDAVIVKNPTTFAQPSCGYLGRFHIHMKMFVFCICFLFGSGANAQIESGTVIVVGLSKDKIVIAADSRVDKGKCMHDDNGCKIMALNDKILFVGVGRVRNGTLWNAYDEARTAFLKTQGTIGNGSGTDFFRTLTSNWANSMAQIITANLSIGEWLRLRDAEPLVIGHFIGLDAGGEIHMWQGAIRAQPGGTGVEVFWRAFPISDSMQFTAIGENSIALEFIANKTDRARKESTQWEQQTATWNQEDVDWLKAVRLVDLSIVYAEPEVLCVIGGAIDAIELRSAGNIVWKQLKSNCPQYQSKKNKNPQAIPATQH